MRARFSRSVALLAAFLLTVAASPARADGAQEKVDTRSYAVADLIVPLTHAHAGKPGKPGKPEATHEERLIKLIVRAVEPATWQENGGRGTIDYYPLSMTLVVSQTPQVHRHLTELLANLRKAQDTEVALEVRFLTVPEGFFERLGANFEVRPGHVAVIQHAGEDCLERIGSDSPSTNNPKECSEKQIQEAVASNSAMAFLNDDQVHKLMEAVQGDQRACVMQAPKITLANGQAGTMNITDKQFFLTGVDVVRDGEHVIIHPKNEPKTTGFQMLAQPVVSADRRYVQLFLKINQTDLTSAAVPLMPVTIPDGVRKGESLTQYVQQPTFSTLSVEKRVAIPDGGTVLFGGSRKTVETQPGSDSPVLSKVPYIHRLFRNVGHSRESQLVFVLVTPRILVNEEAEVQIGKTTPRGPYLPRPLSHASHADVTACPKLKDARYADAAMEEQEPPVRPAEFEGGFRGTPPSMTKVLTALLKAYDEACAEGRLDDADKLARAALTFDPTCFRGKR